MARNTDLSLINFEVGLRPVGVLRGTDGAGEGDVALRERGAVDVNKVGVLPGYRAVTRLDSGEVLAIVSSDYQLMSNATALELGKSAFSRLFPSARAEDFQVYDIRQTKNGSSCHVDLIHRDWKTEVWEQETWLPYLRVSNSYNRSRALSFDLGFVRSLCSNGMIFRQRTIRAKYYHTRGGLDIDLENGSSFANLADQERAFSVQMLRMKGMEWSPEILLPLTLYLLELNFRTDDERPERRDREMERLARLVPFLAELLHGYVEQLGNNGYAVLNAATDLATHHPSRAGNFSSTNGLQRHIGGRVEKLVEFVRRLGVEKVPSLIDRERGLVALVS